MVFRTGNVLLDIVDTRVGKDAGSQREDEGQRRRLTKADARFKTIS